ncbi:hypothetical protein [Paludisphaera sp.]|uniref:hypothetical protein n=1 Tax=Paludisphaera sp. TaxID=2017432 RepID=UPI00301D9C5A
MYRIPADLDLSPAVGESTTQIRVGRHDLHFAFGPVHFAVQSPIRLFRDGRLVASWEGGRWPPPDFYDVMDAEVRRWRIPDDRRVVLELANGIEIHLEDDADEHECFQITVEGRPSPWII